MSDLRGYAIGVDLGTSNTVAVVRWPDGRTRPLLFDGVPVMPSAVYLDEAGLLHVGRDAQRMAALDPARLEPNPKRRVDEAGVLLGDREVSTVDLLAAVLAAVARAAVEAAGFLPPAVMTYPAAWGPRRREVLAAAATRAGWPPVRFVAEPVAAARYFADVLRRPVPVGQALAVFDFGGGTLDVAVVRNDGPAGFTVLGDGGLTDLGGLDVDAALVVHLGQLLERTQPAAWQPLTRPGGTSTQLRQRRLFWDDVRGAKEMLSRTPVAPVAVPGVEQAVHLTREELERIAGPLLQRGVYETAAVIQRCGLRPDQLAGLFLVGGSSRLPLVARLLHAHLGIAPTVLEQPELPVAEGAIAELVPPAGSAALSPTPVSPAPAPPVSPPPTLAPPPAAAPARPSSRRRRPLWIAGAAVVALVAVLAAVALLWPERYPEVNFTSNLAEPVSVSMDMASDASVSGAFVALSGGHAFLGMASGKSMTVQDWDIAGRKQHWIMTVDESRASSVTWLWLQVVGDTVLIAAQTYGTGATWSLHGVRVANGDEPWNKPLSSDQKILVAGSSVVVTDPKSHTVAGMDPHTGNATWRQDYPKDQYGSQDAAVLGVTTDADLARPAGFDGDPDPGGAADTRLVVIGADRSAEVRDAATGNVKARQANVGDPDDLYLAYAGRLYVAGKDAGYRVVSYNLGDLKGQRLVYTSADPRQRARALRPCGGRVCLLDQTSYDDKSTQVRAVDPDAGKALWSRPAANADTITPVGDRILVSGGSSQVFNVLYGPGGGTVLADDNPVWVRISAGSLLLFSDKSADSAGDVTVSGLGAQSKKKTVLGVLRGVRSSSCAWTDELLVCARDNDVGIWKLTG
ncbi:MAG: hypothetical protein V7603_3292 [Micromonosporaceae bacterium]